MQPVLDLFDQVCVVQSDDANFASPVWLDLITGGKGYSLATLKKELKTGEGAFIAFKHTLEIEFIDPASVDTIRGWIASGKSLQVYAYGPNGCVLWMTPTDPLISDGVDTGDGKPANYTISFTKTGFNLDIRHGVNLLFPSLANGSSVARFSAATNGTLTSASKNGSFANGVSPVLKFVQSGAGLSAVHTGGSTGTLELPVKSGMVFSVFGHTYLYNQTSAFNRKIGLKVFDGSLAQTELLTVSDSGTGAATLTGQLTVANASSKQAAFYLEVNNTGGSATAEFDNLMLVCGPATITSFSEN
ncbi:MAG: hypothetical protein HUU10_15610 [Bacteroidetes bacterium]|nr:hypothetical protein [Bacteroidota bacterium]